jgi:hypothetical protein
MVQESLKTTNKPICDATLPKRLANGMIFEALTITCLIEKQDGPL